MGCSSCGGRIRRLARQYQYTDVEPVSKETIEERKRRLEALQAFTIVVEEVDSEYTEQIEDLSTIHTV
jgi:hypothetical protein